MTKLFIQMRKQHSFKSYMAHVLCTENRYAKEYAMAYVKACAMADATAYAEAYAMA